MAAAVRKRVAGEVMGVGQKVRTLVGIVIW